MGVINKPDTIFTQLAELERRLRIMENTGRVTDAVVKQGWPVNKYKAYAYASADHAATDGAFNTLQLDSIKYDSSNSWGTAAFQYTIPVAGYYHLEARAGCLFPAANGAYQYFFVGLFVNGSEVTRGHGQNATRLNPDTFGTQTLSSYVGSKLYLAAGDTVQFRGYPQSFGAPTMVGSAGGGTTYAMIHLLST